MDTIDDKFTIPAIAVAFLALTILTNWLQKKLRKRELAKQGQDNDYKSVAPIRDRIAAHRAWSSGEIKSEGLLPTIILWIGTMVWFLTFGVAFIKSFSNPEMKTPAQIMLGIFSLGGFVFAFFAVQFTMRLFRFGVSTCSINGKAGVLGKDFEGWIRVGTVIKPLEDYQISLQCLEHYTVGTGKNRRSETTVHWKGKQKVPHAGSNPRSGIPFSIPVPKYPPETGYQLGRGKITWQLRIDAPVKGVDYSAIFIVPVFKMDA